MTPQMYLGAAILAIIVALSGLTYYYHSKYQEGITKYEVLQSKNDDLIAALESNNLAIKQLRQDSLQREEAAKKALVEVQKEFDKYVERSQGYLTAIPKDVNLCISANLLLNSYLESTK